MQVLLYLPEATNSQQAAAISPDDWVPESASAAVQLSTGDCKAKLANFGWSHAPCDTCRPVMPDGWQRARPHPVLPAFS